MASPAEIGQPLPETLPEDFGDWDSQLSSATQAAPPDVIGASRGLEAVPKPTVPAPEPEVSAQPATAARYAGVDVPRAFGVAPKSPPPTTEPEVTTAKVVDRSRAAVLPSHARVAKNEKAVVQRPAAATPVATVSPIPISRVEEAGHPAEQAPQPSFDEFLDSLRPKIAAMQVEGETRKKKWMIIGAISACSILVLSILGVWLFSSGTPSTMKASGAAQPAKTEAKLTAGTPKPSPSTPSIPEKLPAPVPAQQTQVSAPTPVTPATEAQNQDTPPAVQPKMMNDQLAAPVRISQEIKKPAAGNEPPPAGFGATGMEAPTSGGAIASVFSKAPPIVHAAPANPITISAGVAGGLLIQKTTPAYPAIAKNARVSGTVQLQATISKDGTVKDLRVVAGPAMLRQAALDAVRTWRYKPYRLDSEPTEVQTTINVIFSLGG